MTTATKAKSWSEAFCKAQAEFGEIPKDSEVNTGKFSYTYASLPAILRIVLPVLHKHGLYLMQSFDDSGRLTTTIGDTFGEVRESVLPMPTPMQMTPQDYGKVVTYMRRYALTAFLGLAPDDDVDALNVPQPPPAEPPPQPDAPKPEAVADPIQAVCVRLADESKSTVKEWTLEPFENRGVALRAIRDLVEVVMTETMPNGWDDEVDLYKATKQKMNGVIDERNQG